MRLQIYLNLVIFTLEDNTIAQSNNEENYLYNDIILFEISGFSTRSIENMKDNIELLFDIIKIAIHR